MKRPITLTRHSSPATRTVLARLLTILLLCGSMASGTGCHVLRIPSYRADSSCGDLMTGGDLATGYPGGNAECPPTVLPPLPGWLAAWHEKKKTPQPPAYPRFQPLPTRPMFSPPAAEEGFGAGPGVNYGHWPSAENGGMQPSAGLQPGEIGQVAGRSFAIP